MGRLISQQMEHLVDMLDPLISFLTRSEWAQRLGDPSVADFVAGNPHEPPLPEFVEALQKASVPQDDMWFAYKLSEQGARATVAASLRERFGIDFHEDDVAMTPGPFGALATVLRALPDPGDEIVFVSPPWFFYEAMILNAGATPVRVKAEPMAFDLPVEAIAGAITERTRAVLVNSPNNPTGRIYPPESLDALAATLTEASERNGRPVYLLSDESYSRIVFDGREFPTPTAHYASSLLLYTYGKTLLTPGQRVGYIALPPLMPEREQLRVALQLAQVAGGWLFPNAIMQHAMPELDRLSIDIDHLQRKRDRMVEGLRGIGYELNVPEGAFYLLPRSPLEDDMAFTRLLASHDVFVLPGWAVELPGYFRLSLTASDEMIDRSMAGFEAALREAR